MKVILAWMFPLTYAMILNACLLTTSTSWLPLQSLYIEIEPDFISNTKFVASPMLVITNILLLLTPHTTHSPSNESP